MGGGAPAQSAPMTPTTTTANVMDIHQKITILEAGVQLVTSQLQQLEVTVGILQSRNEAQSVEMKDAIQVAFAQEKLEIQQIVTHAQDEFKNLRAMDSKTQSDLAALYKEMNAAVHEIRSQMRILQD